MLLSIYILSRFLGPVQPGQGGRFFGMADDFVGLAVVVNTNRNLLTKARPGEPVGRHRDVSVVANNGTRRYDDLVAGLEGCTANVRFDERRDDFNVMQVRGLDDKRGGLCVGCGYGGRYGRAGVMGIVGMVGVVETVAGGARGVGLCAV